MQNQFVIGTGSSKSLVINDLQQFIKEHCRANYHLQEYTYTWFNEQGQWVGENEDESDLLIEEEKFPSGIYFTYCEDPEEFSDSNTFGVYIKTKENEIREIDEIELILGFYNEEQVQSLLKTDEEGKSYYNTYFPLDLEFNRI
jgi:hypothetical protein